CSAVGLRVLESLQPHRAPGRPGAVLLQRAAAGGAHGLGGGAGDDAGRLPARAGAGRGDVRSRGLRPLGWEQLPGRRRGERRAPLRPPSVPMREYFVSLTKYFSRGRTSPPQTSSLILRFLVVLGSPVVLGMLVFVAWPLPPALLELDGRLSLRVLDREGELLREIPSSQEVRSVSLPVDAPIPGVLRDAFIASEDRRV